jgi:AAA+ ATPase superfamily predicted ATPase
MSELPTNPFRYETIDARPEVINRVSDRQRLREALSEPGRRLLIHGRRRMGKTTLCKSVVEELKAEGLAVMMVDFSTATQLADLSNALLQQITTASGKNWQDYLGDLMRALTLQLETEVDPLTGAIKVRLKPVARTAPIDEQRATFVGILDRANELAKQQGRHFGLVIDEFQELARFEDEATLWNLRAVIQHHSNMSYVFTGSSVHLINMLMSSDRAFYKMFSAINFEPVPLREMRNWLVGKFKASGVSQLDALDRLLELAETCTVDRLRLAAMSFPLAAASGELTEPMVDRAYRAIIAEDQAYFQSDWQQFTQHQQNILRAMAEGEMKLGSESVRRRFSLPASGSVSNTLKALLERGVLYGIESAPGYAYDNPYFKEWVHQRNRLDLGLS